MYKLSQEEKKIKRIQRKHEHKKPQPRLSHVVLKKIVLTSAIVSAIIWLISAIFARILS